VLVEQAGHFRPVPVAKATQALPGLILYRFNHSMYYANADLLATEVLDLLKTGPDPVTWFCIDMVAVDDVDFSAAAVLRHVYDELNARSTRLVFTDASDQVHTELERSGIVDLVGKDAFFDDTFEVIEAYRKVAGKQQ
jgi:MFS superfamily sulfate permease-like transporter